MVVNVRSSLLTQLFGAPCRWVWGVECFLSVSQFDSHSFRFLLLIWIPPVCVSFKKISKCMNKTSCHFLIMLCILKNHQSCQTRHMFQLLDFIFITLCDILGRTVAPDHLKGLTSAVVRFITPSACRQHQNSESFERFHSWMEDWTMIVVSVCVVDWLTDWEVNWSPDSTLVHWYSVVRCFY